MAHARFRQWADPPWPYVTTTAQVPAMASDTRSEPRYRTWQLFKDAPLGSGAYGTVYLALCDGLLCAAKIMHRELVVQRVSKHGQDDRLPWKRFDAECTFLSSLRHPNIVQYLDKKLDSESQSILLMEMLDESLTKFLDKCKTNLPFHTEVNICHDISLALVFLHSNGIVHRDLSSNNILMFGDRRAKISDFGMAKMFKQFEKKSRSLTGLPGTKEYMPPEVFDKTPSYKYGVDCFSFGVLTLQVITLAYPEPAHEYAPVTEDLLRRVPEVERRQAQIELAPRDHFLLPVMANCLKDKEDSRPTADDISSIVSSLTQSDEYIRSKEKHNPEKLRREKEKEISKIMESNRHEKLIMQERFSLQLADVKEENEQLAKQLLAERHDNNHIIMEARNSFLLEKKALEEERDQERQKLKFAHAEIAERNEMIEKLKLQIKILQRSRRDTTSSLSEGDSGNATPVSPERNTSSGAEYKMLWKFTSKPAIRSLIRASSDCVMCSGSLFIQPVTKSRKIYGYQIKEDHWEEISPCPNDGAALARINNTLLALGGRTSETNFLSCIHYLVLEQGRYTWKEADFRLPTKRSSVVAINTQQYLIVAGGEGEESTLRLVEVMDTGTRSWMCVAELPESLVGASVAVCSDTVYLVGGQFGYNRVFKNSVFSCSIADLIASRRKIGQKAKASKTTSNPWNRFNGPQFTESTCISLDDCLYIIGGMHEDHRATNAVYAYMKDQKGKPKWTRTGYMNIPRYRCFAATCAEPKKILVIGGYTNLGRTDSMEFTEL